MIKLYPIILNLLFSLLEDSHRFLLNGIFGRTLTHLGHLVLVLTQFGIEGADFLIDRFGSGVNLCGTRRTQGKLD